MNIGTLLAGEDQTNNRLLTGVTPADADSVLETLQNAVGATGNGSAIDLKGYSRLSVHITGTFVATVTFEATLDDTNWFTIGLSRAVDGAFESTPTAVGAWYLPSGAPAYSQLRARVSAWTSGTVTAESRKHARY